MAGRKTIDLSINREPEERPEPKLPPQFLASRFEQPTSEMPKKKQHGWGKWIILAVVLVGILKALIYFNLIPSGNFPAVDNNKFQAVFLGNGMVYFGHLKEMDRAYAALEKPYYVQQAPAATGTQQQSGFNLVKIEQELHQPENKMFIPKSQILFWENLKADSPIAKYILTPPAAKK